MLKENNKLIYPCFKCGKEAAFKTDDGMTGYMVYSITPKRKPICGPCLEDIKPVVLFCIHTVNKI